VRLEAPHIILRIAQCVDDYGIVDSSAGRALWDSRISQWVEHYGIVG